MKEEKAIELLKEAKELYRNGKFTRALDANRRVKSANSGDIYQVRALRFCGVCLYRLGKLEESLKELQKAKELALRIDTLNEAQLVDNHLGATLLRMGRPDEALKVFQSSLQRVSRVEGLAARARIFGNLGSLYDEAGQRALADECYVRYEELCMLSDDKHHLANAHGLLSRTEIARGRLDEAQRHVEEEARLAAELGDNGRILNSRRHQANLCIARARHLQREGRGDEAKALLAEATRYLDDADKRLSKEEIARRVSVLRARARIAELQGRCPAALELLRGAMELLPEKLQGTSFSEQRASVLQDLAGIARTLGLSGEALYYLEQSAEVRWKQWQGLTDRGEDINALFAPRFAELRSLAESLIQEARAVPRNDAEREGLVRLLTQLGMGEASDKINELEDSLSLKLRARTHAKSYWQRTLGTDIFDQLHEHSQDDLITSDIVYHGAVDDLGRSAHLIVVVFERELRHRFTRIITEIFNKNKPWQWQDSVLTELEKYKESISIGSVFRIISLVTGKKEKSDFIHKIRESFHHYIDNLKAVSTINKPIKSAQGELLEIMAVRNRVAHGRYEGHMPTRLDVDAFRRHLLFGAKSPLAHLVGISARP